MFTKYTKNDYQVTSRYRKIVNRLENSGITDENEIHSTANAIMRLFYINCALNTINENEANGWPKPVSEFRNGKFYRYNVENERWRKRDERKEARLLAEVKQINDACPFIDIRSQGDCRGSAIKLNVNRGNEQRAIDMLNYSGYDTDLICKD